MMRRPLRLCGCASHGSPGALGGGRGTEVAGFVISDVQEIRVELGRQPKVGKAGHAVHGQVHRIQLHVSQVVQPG